jgi:hypothetical protein
LETRCSCLRDGIGKEKRDDKEYQLRMLKTPEGVEDFEGKGVGGGGGGGGGAEESSVRSGEEGCSSVAARLLPASFLPL